MMETSATPREPRTDEETTAARGSARIRLRLEPHAAAPPRYASAGAAGADLYAAVAEGAPTTLAPGAIAPIPTGLVLALPAGVEAQIRPRSGLASRHGVTVVNAPGTIDWDYRGEILVPLINLGSATFVVERGMRIAQMVFAPVIRGVFERVDNLDATARGASGFGSTGTVDAYGEARKKD